MTFSHGVDLLSGSEDHAGHTEGANVYRLFSKLLIYDKKAYCDQLQKRKQDRLLYLSFDVLKRIFWEKKILEKDSSERMF